MPTVNNSMKPFKESDVSKVIERLLKLSVSQTCLDRPSIKIMFQNVEQSNHRLSTILVKTVHITNKCTWLCSFRGLVIQYRCA